MLPSAFNFPPKLSLTVLATILLGKRIKSPEPEARRAANFEPTVVELWTSPVATDAFIAEFEADTSKLMNQKRTLF